MKLTLLKEEYKIFQVKYENLSGLKLPYQYLEKSDVYVFRRNKDIIGGFILGNNIPLRTLELFVSESNKNDLSYCFEQDKFCEICCFWIDKKFRRKIYYNAMFWIGMANVVAKQKKEFIIYGTNSRSLAEMYGYPKNSLLIHKDLVQDKNTFVFLVRRGYFLGGALEMIFGKILRRDRNSNLEQKDKLRTELINEISK